MLINNEKIKRSEITIMKQIWAAIKDHQQIICLTHINSDGDAYASQIGLALLITTLFPDKEVSIINDANARFPDWNQYLTAPPKTLSPPILVIITDTAFLARINSQYWQQATTLIKIDHHGTSDYDGDIAWVNSKASSTAEMITRLIVHLKLPITNTIAAILYSGIVSDSNRFHYPTVSSTTFTMLAFLMTYNCNLPQLYQQYYQQTLVTLQLKALILERYVLSANKIISCCLPVSLLAPLAITAFHANEYVDLLAHIDGAILWMMFSEQPNGTIIGIFRSNMVPVNAIVAKFGGGGHNHYAGGTFKDWTVVQAIINYCEDVVTKSLVANNNDNNDIAISDEHY